MSRASSIRMNRSLSGMSGTGSFRNRSARGSAFWCCSMMTTWNRSAPMTRPRSLRPDSWCARNRISGVGRRTRWRSRTTRRMQPPFGLSPCRTPRTTRILNRPEHGRARRLAEVTAFLTNQQPAE
jgi:hypothetical protein